MPDKNIYVPITGATINIFNEGDNMNTASPVQTLAAVSGQAGNYRGEELDEGNYFLVASASGRGRIVHPFTLPNPTAPEDLIKYIGPLNMVAGLPVLNVNVVDKDDVPITTGMQMFAAKLLAVHVSAGAYTVGNVPVGSQMIEVVPTNPDVYQNLKILRDITNPMDPVNITLNPPVTLNVTVRLGNQSSNVIDTTCRLFEMSGNTKVREFQRQGNIFPINRLADGEITVRAFGPSGDNALGDAQTYQIAYSNTGGTGVLNRSYYYTIGSVSPIG